MVAKDIEQLGISAGDWELEPRAKANDSFAVTRPLDRGAEDFSADAASTGAAWGISMMASDSLLRVTKRRPRSNVPIANSEACRLPIISGLPQRRPIDKRSPSSSTANVHSSKFTDSNAASHPDSEPMLAH